MTTTTEITYDLSSATVPRAQRRARRIAILIRVALLIALLVVTALNVRGDEACSSPCRARIEEQAR
ncbi:MAG TPA: hypothetical protein VM940_17245 [Chthoniobacterales bacterium]|jgi:hypothetical protein|nr:hypothetical protein [Chthoniobacterales bacterium]